MKAKATCDRDHAGEMKDEELKAVEDLPQSQAGAGRHRCALCAYLLGLQHGKEQMVAAMVERLEEKRGAGARKYGIKKR